MNNQKLNIAQQFVLESIVSLEARGAGEPGWNAFLEKFYSLTKDGNIEIYIHYVLMINRTGIARYDFDPLNGIDIYGKAIFKDGILFSVETYPENIPNESSILTQEIPYDELLKEPVSISHSCNLNLAKEYKEKKIHEEKREKNLFYGKKYCYIRDEAYKCCVKQIKDKYYNKAKKKFKEY